MANKRIFSLILIACLLTAMVAMPTHAVGDIIFMTGAAAQAAGAAGAATIGGMSVSSNISGDDDWYDGKMGQTQRYVRTLLADGTYLNQSVAYDFREGTIYFKPEDINLSLAVMQEMALENNFVAPPELQASGWSYFNFPSVLKEGESTQLNVSLSAGFPVAVTPVSSWNVNFVSYTLKSSIVQLDSINFPDGSTLSIEIPESTTSYTYPFFAYGGSKVDDNVLLIDAYSSSNASTYTRMATLKRGDTWSIEVTPETRSIYYRFTLYISEKSQYNTFVQAGALYNLCRTYPILGGTAPGVFQSDVKFILPTVEQIEDRYQNEEAQAIAFTPMKSDGTPLLAGIDNGDDAAAALMEAYINGQIASFVIDGEATIPGEDTENSVLDSILATLIDVKNKVRDLPQSIYGAFAGTLTAIKEGVLSIAEVLEPHPPNWDNVFPPGGFGAFGDWHLDSIWHYVTAWLASMSAGIGAFFTVFGVLPYGLVAPVYATAVIVIIVGLYKRYIA